ncbi:MAG TPA: phage holin family protein [Burkholderiales bacterium]|jgi:hypothetical protein|nr:phage holin family protein [Burkholderiales bacterium]
MSAVPQFTAAQRKPPGLSELLGRVLSETRALVTDYAELAVLDARRAGIRLAWLLGSGLMVAILVITAWMAGIAAGIVWMWGEGVSWPAAIGIAALINLVGAGALVWWMRSLVVELPFTALLRQLKGEPPKGEGEPPHAS